LIKHNTYGFIAALITECLGFTLWILLTMVPGFGMADNPNNLSNASTATLTGSGWWMVIEFWFAVFGAFLPFFSLSYDKEENQIEKGILPVIRYYKFYCAILVVVLLVDITHIITLVVDQADFCTTTFCMLNPVFWWCYFALIICLFLVHIWLGLRVAVLWKNMNLLGTYQKIKPVVAENVMRPETKPPQQQAQQSSSALKFTVASQIKTPLLQGHAKNSKKTY
jgi:hypothetical protein